MALFHANEDNFKELVLDSTEPVLVDFWATWCGPCQLLAPALEELSQQVKVVKVEMTVGMMKIPSWPWPFRFPASPPSSPSGTARR